MKWNSSKTECMAPDNRYKKLNILDYLGHIITADSTSEPEINLRGLLNQSKCGYIITIIESEKNFPNG